MKFGSAIAGLYLAAWLLGAEAADIRIGYFPNITHAQAIYAKATGEFEKETGASVKWQAFNAGPTAIESLFADAIDATYIGPGPAINGFIKSKGEQFVIVSGAASGGAGLVVRSDCGIDTDRDFNGKNIATPQLGNTQDIAARVWLADHKYKLKEKGGTVALIPVSNPDQFTLFKKKQIDGAWTVEPWISRLEVEAGGRLFLEEKALWPDGRYVTTALVMSKTFLQKNPELAKKLVAAHVEVTERINRDKSAAATILNEQLTKDTGKALKPEVIKRAMERVEFTWDPIAKSLFQGARSAYRIGFLKSPPELNGILSLELLNSVLKQKQLEPINAK
ncbi:MAG TPA: ABC transporter substrate-binding protein [Verrucomicrobiae bacterium]|jgi:NitT/TauT family transport system substrate-binding protein|nr:ABC transporter substrate-binding protein [Verrucomicrobiae bacterium]